jgi:hypothetical protein
LLPSATQEPSTGHVMNQLYVQGSEAMGKMAGNWEVKWCNHGSNLK